MQRRITRATLIETLVWVVLAIGAFWFSFGENFSRNIETYRFNATGWPRTIIILMVVALAANFFTSWRGGSSGQDMLSGNEDDDEERKAITFLGAMRIGAMLLLPIIYANFLQSVGFYILTPIFILLLLLLMGERRPLYLLVTTCFIYGLLVLFFGKLLYLNLPTGTWQPAYDFSNWLLTVIR